MFGQNESSTYEMILRAVDEATEPIHRVGDGLKELTTLGAGFVLGGLELEAIQGMADGLASAGRNMVQLNAQAETLRMTLTTIYQSSAEASSAFDWMQTFALNAPFTYQSIVQAGVQLAAAGNDITTAMPAIAAAAAVAGTNMQTATQAFVDAQHGLSRMLERDLYIRPEQLIPYGLKMDANRHIDPSTFAPAFEAFVAKNDPNALNNAMQTATGLWSNFVDQVQRFERISGAGIFESFKGDLKSIIDTVSANRATVDAFAASLGEGLGTAAGMASTAIGQLLSDIPPAIGIISGLWDALQGPRDALGGAIGGALAGFVTFLQQQVLPHVATALNTMIGWWQTHGDDVVKVLDTIAGDVQKMVGFLGANLGSGMSIVAGIWQIGWGLMEGIAATAQGIIEADASKHSSTLADSYKNAVFGLDDVFQGMEEAVARFLDQGLYPAIVQLHDWGQKALKPFEDWAANVLLLMDALKMQVENKIVEMANGALKGLNDMLSKLPDWMPLHQDKMPANFNPLATPFPDIGQAVTNDLPGIMRFVGLQGGGVGSGPLGPQPNVNADMKRIQDFFAQQKEDYLAQQSRQGDAQATAELLRMRGVQGPTHPAGVEAPGSTANKNLDALLAKLDEWSKKGFTLGGVTLPGVDPNAGKGGLLPPGGGIGEDPKTIHAALSAAVSQAKEQFQLDILNNAPQTKLLADIAIILSDMKKAGDAGVTIALERARDLKQIADHTKTAATHLGVNNPLLGFRLPQEASFGGSVISFASLQEASNREDRRQLMAQVAALQQQNAALQQQNAALQEGNGHQAATAHSVARIASSVGRAPQSVDSLLRTRGTALATR